MKNGSIVLINGEAWDLRSLYRIGDAGGQGGSYFFRLPSDLIRWFTTLDAEGKHWVVWKLDAEGIHIKPLPADAKFLGGDDADHTANQSRQDGSGDAP